MSIVPATRTAKRQIPNDPHPMRIRRAFTLVHLMWVVLIAALVMAAAVQQLVQARRASRAYYCRYNLRQLGSIKEQWTMDHHAELTDTPTIAALREYTKGSSWTCPDGGTYLIGTVAEAPRCSLGERDESTSADDHVLSAAEQHQFSGVAAVRGWKSQLARQTRPDAELRAAIRTGSAYQQVQDVYQLWQRNHDAAEALPPLLAAFQGPDQLARASACICIGGLGPAARAAVPRLTAALHDREMRKNAAEALRSIGPDGAAVEALRPLVRDPDPQMRSAAISALGAAGKQARGCFAAIAGHLKDPSPEVRLEAARALSQIDTEASLPLLEKTLMAEKDCTARYWIIQRLGELGRRAKRSTGVLRRIAEDPHENFSAQAQDALAKIAADR